MPILPRWWQLDVGPICPIALGEAVILRIHDDGRSQSVTYFPPMVWHVHKLNVLDEELAVRIEFQHPAQYLDDLTKSRSMFAV